MGFSDIAMLGCITTIVVTGSGRLDIERGADMAIKKTGLYSSLWAGCDELRGGMDASQYKDYVLTLLFLKYVSDRYAGDPHGVIVVPDECTFERVAALKGDKEIGDKLNKLIARLAKTKDIRQGMMQELLTGRTRLV